MGTDLQEIIQETETLEVIETMTNSPDYQPTLDNLLNSVNTLNTLVLIMFIVFLAIGIYQLMWRFMRWFI